MATQQGEGQLGLNETLSKRKKQREGRKERGKKGFLVLFSPRRISVTGVQYYEKVA